MWIVGYSFRIYRESPVFTGSLPYLPRVSRIYRECPVFTASLPYLPGVSHIYRESLVFS